MQNKGLRDRMLTPAMQSDPDILLLLNNLTSSRGAAASSALSQQQQKNQLRSMVFGDDHKHLQFPIKLHRLVSCSAITEMQWTCGGMSFNLNKKGYEQRIMRTFFSQSHIKGLENQLSKYGFQCVETGKGKDTLVYFHPKFQAGREDLCREIERVRPRPSAASKGTDTIISCQSDKGIFDGMSISPISLSGHTFLDETESFDKKILSAVEDI
mmetsp:Transcript_34694/g.76219  ORF Transcript_34694/g.76219 Transcript_34694/m.76219 type:complete len:212 (+) Transcript_34694:180-815(+)